MNDEPQCCTTNLISGVFIARGRSSALVGVALLAALLVAAGWRSSAGLRLYLRPRANRPRHRYVVTVPKGYRSPGRSAGCRLRARLTIPPRTPNARAIQISLGVQAH